MELVGGYRIWYMKQGEYDWTDYGRVTVQDKPKVCRTLMSRKAIVRVKATPIQGTMFNNDAA